MKYKTIFLLILFTVTTVSAQIDSALVRIRTDVDSAKIQINNQGIFEDSYGNPLIKNSWFIIWVNSVLHGIDISKHFSMNSALR